MCPAGSVRAFDFPPPSAATSPRREEGRPPQCACSLSMCRQRPEAACRHRCRRGHWGGKAAGEEGKGGASGAEETQAAPRSRRQRASTTRGSAAAAAAAFAAGQRRADTAASRRPQQPAICSQRFRGPPNRRERQQWKQLVKGALGPCRHRCRLSQRQLGGSWRRRQPPAGRGRRACQRQQCRPCAR